MVLRNRKFKKRTFKRRGRFIKRRMFRKRRMRISSKRMGTIVPDKIRVTMRYTQNIARAPGAVTDEYVFRGNSLFDPDLTGSGAQPTGFDQWEGFYTKYKVNASKILVMIVNTSATAGIFASLIPSLTSTGVTSPPDAISTPYSRYYFGSGVSATPKITLKNYMTTRKIYGESTISEDNYEALFSANPVNEWYWILNVGDIAAATNVTYQFIVVLKYFIELSERKPLNQSSA